MNVKAISQLIHVSVMLERDEELAALDDPSELLLQLRKALGDAIEPTAIGHLNGHKRAVPKSRRTRRGAGRRHGAAQASTMIACPQCGKEVNGKMGLGVHMARKHGTVGAPAAGD